MKKRLRILGIMVLAMVLLAGCGQKQKNTLADGQYTATFETDSSMFRLNETMDGKGVLTVKNGEMTIHVTLLSKKILNLYPGLAADASKNEDDLLQPVVDVVTYQDGTTEEVYGFDIPVPQLEEEFDVALIGSKGKWYDHKVKVCLCEDVAKLADGEHLANVTLTGGSGKATVESPARILVENGKMTAVIVWSSKNYDYMLVDGEKYLNEAAEGENSQFTIPVKECDTELPVIGDTTAMGTPHEIEYTLRFEIQE